MGKANPVPKDISNTVQNYREAQSRLTKFKYDKTESKEKIPDNVCPICKKELKNELGKQAHMRMAHKGK